MADNGDGSYQTISGDNRDIPVAAETHRDTSQLQPQGTLREEDSAHVEDRDEDAEDMPFINARKEDDVEEDDEDDLYDPLANTPGYDGILEEKEESKSMWYLFILALSIMGLQISWATELSNGSPYLLSLGLNKSLLSFVWIAGPLMGVLVQPYVGILSDRSRSKWGKRRPFMVAGAAATSISFIALAWSREIISWALGIFGAEPDSRGVKVTVIVWAVLWVYILDFAINAVQAAIRAFIVDCAPTHQQEDANAWAGRLLGFGSILGYLSGYVNLPRYFSFFGDTQFKVLSVFASLSLSITVLISCLYISERDPRLDEPLEARKPFGVLSFFRQTYHSMLRLPPQIRKVCEVQFFNWMGWFPFLFYITTYIGQLYVNPIFEENPDLPPDEVDKQWEIATRVGSFALFVNSLVSFVASIVVPMLVVPTYSSLIPANRSMKSSTSLNRLNDRIQTLVSRLQIPNFTLRRAWLASHLFYAFCMLATFFATTPAFGTVIVALLGFSWAITMWAPFALISAEISKRDAMKRARRGRLRNRRQYSTAATGLQREVTDTTGEGSADASEAGDLAKRNVDLPDEDEEDQAGVVLGLHNVSISAPQIVATLLSSGIFKLLQRDRGTAGDDSVAWVLRLGGIAVLIAAYMTWRLREEGEGLGTVHSVTGGAEHREPLRRGSVEHAV